MSAFVYAGQQYHLLAGNKIVKDATLLDMKETDKIIVNGQGYNLGIGSPVIPETPSASDAPECNIVYENGIEPSTGTKWYITPEGAGSMDGTNWANAANASTLNVLLLSCNSGDSFYFLQGQYTTSGTITLTKDVSLYGGFSAYNPSWETRDAFLHQTIWTSTYDGPWMTTMLSSTLDSVIDGFTVVNYTSGGHFGTSTLFRNIFISGGAFSFNGTAYNSKFVNTDLNAGTISGCWINSGSIYADSLVDCTVIGTDSRVKNALNTDFYFGNTSITVSANTVNIYGTESELVIAYLTDAVDCTVIYGKALRTGETLNCIFNGSNNKLQNCTAINCRSTDEDSSLVSQACIFYSLNYPVLNCNAINCTCKNTRTKNNTLLSSSIFKGRCKFSNCAAVKCSVINGGTSIYLQSYIFQSIKVSDSDSDEGIVQACTAVNCTNIITSTSTELNYSISKQTIFSGYKAFNCEAVNCSCTGGYTIPPQIFSGYAVDCSAINCIISSTKSGWAFNEKAINCIAINCTCSAQIHAYIYYNSYNKNCSAVNCINTSSGGYNYIFREGINCLSWNNSGEEFYQPGQTCASSNLTYTSILVLGTDNSIARFTNTGFAPTKGVQDVGDCPSPIDDPDGYSEWIAAFGDWHPASNSFLLGAGTADEDVTTDADGVTRPDPPSIGAYEAKPVQETNE